MNVRSLVGVGVVVCVVLSGCSRKGGPQESRAASDVTGVSHVPPTPGATVEYISKLRNEGRYVELRAFIERSQASGVVDFLLAMDELLAANDEVQAAIRDKAPAAPALTWDLGPLKNRQGLLSADVKVIDEQIEGPQAWVTIQVENTVPLEKIPLRRVDGRWVYWPESEVGELPEALRGLSRSLKRIASTIRRESLDEDGIAAEFRLCIQPRLRQIETVAAQLARGPASE